MRKKIPSSLRQTKKWKGWQHQVLKKKFKKNSGESLNLMHIKNEKKILLVIA